MIFPLFFKSLDPSGQARKYEFRLRLDDGAAIASATVTDVTTTDQPTTDNALAITAISFATVPDADGATGVTFSVSVLTEAIAGSIRLLRLRYTLADGQGSDRTMRLRVEQI